MATPPVYEAEMIKATNAIVLQAAPGASPTSEVGSVEWLQALFPSSEDRFTISFGDENKVKVSFTEEFLAKNFDYFKACLASSTVESERKETALPENMGKPFALIVAYLVVGVFPRLPHSGPNPSDALTDRLEAACLADYLGLANGATFAQLLEADVRQLLVADRRILTVDHLNVIYRMNAPAALAKYSDIFAAAAVKPVLCGWMKLAKRETIEASIAAKYLDMDVSSFQLVVQHYDGLLAHFDYRHRVFKEVQQTISKSKRLNKLSIDEAAPGQKTKIKNLPEAVDHVTYLDPLPIPIGDRSIFTI